MLCCPRARCPQCRPSLHNASEVLRTYFDPDNLDDAMGGSRSADSAWDKNEYGKLMMELDEEVERSLTFGELDLIRRQSMEARGE